MIRFLFLRVLFIYLFVFLFCLHGFSFLDCWIPYNSPLILFSEETSLLTKLKHSWLVFEYWYSASTFLSSLVMPSDKGRKFRGISGKMGDHKVRMSAFIKIS